MNTYLFCRVCASCNLSFSPALSVMSLLSPRLFFFNDTATTEIYTLSLHDALPISASPAPGARASPPGWRRPAPPPRRGSPPWRARARTSDAPVPGSSACASGRPRAARRDRKSTRLNSSHDQISYAVFCLKKNKNNNNPDAAQHDSKDDVSCVGRTERLACDAYEHRGDD